MERNRGPMNKNRKGHRRMSANSIVQRVLKRRWLHRPVQTRMPGGAGAGAGLTGQSPATRLSPTITSDEAIGPASISQSGQG